MPFKKIIVTMVGGTILVFGLALLVLPGPAFLVIPLGLAVLATEFVWARRWLRRAKGMVNQRKARRTTRAVWVTCRRKWDRWRFRWRRHHSAKPVASAIPLKPPGSGAEVSAAVEAAEATPASNRQSPAPALPSLPAQGPAPVRPPNSG